MRAPRSSAKRDSPRGTRSRSKNRSSILLERAADHEALDITRALVDLRDAHVAPKPLDREVGHVAVAAVDLDGVRTYALGHFGGEELRHRSLLDAGLARVAKPCRVKIALP